MTIVIPDRCLEVIHNYEGDEKVKEVLERVVVGSEELEGYTLVDRLLRYEDRIVIGDCVSFKRKILQTLHESPLGGRSGIQNTYLRVKQLFHWPRLKTEVKEFVLACDTCKRCKNENIAYLGLL